MSGADFRGNFRDLSLWVEKDSSVVPNCKIMEKHSRTNNDQLWVVEFGSAKQLQKEKAYALKQKLNIVLQQGESLVISGDVPGKMGYDACGSEGDKTVISVSKTPIRGPRPMLKAEKDKYMARARVPSDKNINLLDRVSSDSLAQLITHMEDYTSRNSYSGENGLNQAVDWAAEKLKGYGFAVTREASGEGMTPQVVAELRGVSDPSKIVVVGAHYDSRSTERTSPTQRAPGADDNGSGSAAIVEFARVISESGTKFEHTLRLCLFTGEEQGLVGSRALATRWAAENADIIAMFNADMIGYKQPDAPIMLALMDRNADLDLNEIAKTTTATYLKNKLPVGYTQACCSDQQAFYENGFPAAGFFETPTSSVVYPQYHKSDDLLDKLDIEQIKLQATATMASALIFAGVESSAPSPSSMCEMGIESSNYQCAGTAGFCDDFKFMKCAKGTHCSQAYHKSHPDQNPCISASLRGMVVE